MYQAERARIETAGGNRIQRIVLDYGEAGAMYRPS